MVVATKPQELKLESLGDINPAFRVPASQQIAITLAAIREAGLDEYIDETTRQLLDEYEDAFNSKFNAAPILLAPNKRAMAKAARECADVAFDFYFDTGRAIWKAIENDYTKLRELTIKCSTAVEDSFFANPERLTRKSFSKIIAGIRILRHTGERIIQRMEDTPLEDRIPPIGYFSLAFLGGLVTTCVLSHVNQDVVGTPTSNLRLLADAMLEVGNEAHQMAVDEHLYDDGQAWFWHPQWQLGEAEADLDRLQGRVKWSNSVDTLIEDLHR